jgi:hypothetical protein
MLSHCLKHYPQIEKAVNFQVLFPHFGDDLRPLVDEVMGMCLMLKRGENLDPKHWVNQVIHFQLLMASSLRQRRVGH